MTIEQELMKLDEELKKLSVSFDKGLIILGEKVWEIAERHNTTGGDIMKLYFDMKSKEK